MKTFTKVVIIAAAFLYFVSPVDLVPGTLLDDIIIVILALARRRRLSVS